MRLEGAIWKDKKTKYWVVHIPLLELSTQGTSQKNALVMVKDAIELEVDKANFEIQAVSGKQSGTFTISSNDPDTLVAFMLRRQRESHGLTVREVANNLHSKSPTAYAQYEQGKRSPSMGKLVELLHAIDPNLTPTFKVG